METLSPEEMADLLKATFLARLLSEKETDDLAADLALRAVGIIATWDSDNQCFRIHSY